MSEDGLLEQEEIAEATAPISPLVTPHALYQAAAIDISLVEERLSGHTTLWLAFPEELKEAALFALHCRVSVTDVLINGVPAAFDHRDPLTCLDPEQQHNFSYSTAEIDARFRGALELGVEGELRVTIPTSANAKRLQPLQPVPDSAPEDVKQAFRRLNALCGALQPERATHARAHQPSEMLMQVEEEDGPGSETAGGFRQLLQVHACIMCCMCHLHCDHCCTFANAFRFMIPTG